MSKIVYIAGPITGVEGYIPNFDKADRHLTNDMFCDTINPAYLYHVMHITATHEDYMDVCKVLITKADAIYLLKGWEKSAGAREELKHFIDAGKEIMLEEE